jgi:hypothetical protein
LKIIENSGDMGKRLMGDRLEKIGRLFLLHRGESDVVPGEVPSISHLE